VVAAPARSRLAVIVRVLGSAAGGGVPQWNCACANCSAARAGLQPRRSSSSFAVSGDGETWWLVNVSPDVAQQIEAFAPLQPQARRGTPIAGMLVTDANVDHLGGLAVLRQTGDHAFAIRSTATVRRLAAADRAFSAFTAAPHRWDAVTDGEVVRLDDRLIATAVYVAGLTPGYAGREALPDAVAAYVVVDTVTGGRALFAPVFSDVTATLRDAAERADLAFFDGSFYSDDELAGVDVPKAARSLGHAPISGQAGSLATLGCRETTSRRLYAHVNNTNPILDPSSAAYADITRYGFEVAADGMEFRL
jgi:pyrroloquinoline quinone biosynthesis protein B